MTTYPIPGFTNLVYYRAGYVWVCGDAERIDVYRDASVDPDDDPLLGPVRVFAQAHELVVVWSETKHAESWSGWPWLSSSYEHLTYAREGIEVPAPRQVRALITSPEDHRAVDWMCESISQPQGFERWQADK